MAQFQLTAVVQKLDYLLARIDEQHDSGDNNDDSDLRRRVKILEDKVEIIENWKQGLEDAGFTKEEFLLMEEIIAELKALSRFTNQYAEPPNLDFPGWIKPVKPQKTRNVLEWVKEYNIDLKVDGKVPPQINTNVMFVNLLPQGEDPNKYEELDLLGLTRGTILPCKLKYKIGPDPTRLFFQFYASDTQKSPVIVAELPTITIPKENSLYNQLKKDIIHRQLVIDKEPAETDQTTKRIVKTNALFKFLDRGTYKLYDDKITITFLPERLMFYNHSRLGIVYLKYDITITDDHVQYVMKEYICDLTTIVPELLLMSANGQSINYLYLVSVDNPYIPVSDHTQPILRAYQQYSTNQGLKAAIAYESHIITGNNLFEMLFSTTLGVANYTNGVIGNVVSVDEVSYSSNAPVPLNIANPKPNTPVLDITFSDQPTIDIDLNFRLKPENMANPASHWTSLETINAEIINAGDFLIGNTLDLTSFLNLLPDATTPIEFTRLSDSTKLKTTIKGAIKVRYEPDTITLEHANKIVGLGSKYPETHIQTTPLGLFYHGDAKNNGVHWQDTQNIWLIYTEDHSNKVSVKLGAIMTSAIDQTMIGTMLNVKNMKILVSVEIYQQSMIPTKTEFIAQVQFEGHPPMDITLRSTKFEDGSIGYSSDYELLDYIEDVNDKIIIGANLPEPYIPDKTEYNLDGSAHYCIGTKSNGQDLTGFELEDFNRVQNHPLYFRLMTAQHDLGIYYNDMYFLKDVDKPLPFTIFDHSYFHDQGYSSFVDGETFLSGVRRSNGDHLAQYDKIDSRVVTVGTKEDYYDGLAQFLTMNYTVSDSGAYPNDTTDQRYNWFLSGGARVPQSGFDDPFLLSIKYDTVKTTAKLPYIGFVSFSSDKVDELAIPDYISYGTDVDKEIMTLKSYLELLMKITDQESMEIANLERRVENLETITKNIIDYLNKMGGESSTFDQMMGILINCLEVLAPISSMAMVAAGVLLLVCSVKNAIASGLSVSSVGGILEAIVFIAAALYHHKMNQRAQRQIRGNMTDSELGFDSKLTNEDISAKIERWRSSFDSGIESEIEDLSNSIGTDIETASSRITESEISADSRTTISGEIPNAAELEGFEAPLNEDGSNTAEFKLNDDRTDVIGENFISQLNAHVLSMPEMLDINNTRGITSADAAEYVRKYLPEAANLDLEAYGTASPMLRAYVERMIENNTLRTNKLKDDAVIDINTRMASITKTVFAYGCVLFPPNFPKCSDPCLPILVQGPFDEIIDCLGFKGRSREFTPYKYYAMDYKPRNFSKINSIIVKDDFLTLAGAATNFVSTPTPKSLGVKRIPGTGYHAIFPFLKTGLSNYNTRFYDRLDKTKELVTNIQE